METGKNGNISLVKGEILATVDGRTFKICIIDGAVQVDGRDHSFDINPIGPIGPIGSIGSHSYSLLLGNAVYEITAETVDRDSTTGTESITRISVNGSFFDVLVDDQKSLLIKSLMQSGQHPVRSDVIKAPMPGLVVRIEVVQGQHVVQGQGLLVLEAMKMENEITATHAGVVENLFVTQGKPVEKGEALLSVRAEK